MGVSEVSSSQAIQAPDWGHVHNLALIGNTIYVGAHGGFWKQDGGKEPVLVSQPLFDVMGLSGSSDRWLASGHPGPEMDAPSNLGLIESLDGGVSWQSVSLLGEVDFHRLVISGDTLIGISAHDNSLLRSTNSGQTWSNLGVSSIFDLAVDPKNPEMVVATTENGTIQSADGGMTFTSISPPVQLMLLSWDEEGLYAASVDGQILFSTDNGVNWVQRGTLGGQAMALAVDSSTVVGVVGESIFESTDGGETFVERIGG